MLFERVFDLATERAYADRMSEQLTARQKGILDMIETSMRERGYPPSVREIGEAVWLTSPSTVHSHLASLERMGYLRRDPTKPRAIEVRYDPSSGAAIERRPVRHVPLVGDVAAGTDVLAQERVEELFPLPEDFTGTGDLFMLRVRGDSMIGVGIMMAISSSRSSRPRRTTVRSWSPASPARRPPSRRSSRRVARSRWCRRTIGCHRWSSTPIKSPSSAASSR